MYSFSQPLIYPEQDPLLLLDLRFLVTQAGRSVCFSRWQTSPSFFSIGHANLVMGGGFLLGLSSPKKRAPELPVTDPHLSGLRATPFAHAMSEDSSFCSSSSAASSSSSSSSLSASSLFSFSLSRAYGTLPSTHLPFLYPIINSFPSA